MEYFISMAYGGDLILMDNHIVHLERGDSVFYENETFYVTGKMIDYEEKKFIVFCLPKGINLP